MSSPRAEAIMRRALAEQRVSARVPVCVSASVSCGGQGDRENLALVRDVSNTGIFFYSNFSPSVGSTVALNYTRRHEGKRVEVQCEGVVVRLVKFPSGAATGVGVRLNRHEMMPRCIEAMTAN